MNRGGARRSLAAIAFVTAIVAAPALADDASTAGFTPDEIAKILSHGPWPPPPGRDPSNRVSGDVEAIAFGERLFFDTRLSANGLVSCARCHQPGRHWTDGQARSIGLAPVDRNAPTVVDARMNRWFGWDGANDNLWAQSLRPLLDPREMGMTEAGVAKAIRDVPDFACRYRRTFGRAPAGGKGA